MHIAICDNQSLICEVNGDKLLKKVQDGKYSFMEWSDS